MIDGAFPVRRCPTDFDAIGEEAAKEGAAAGPAGSSFAVLETTVMRRSSGALRLSRGMGLGFTQQGFGENELQVALGGPLVDTSAASVSATTQ